MKMKNTTKIEKHLKIATIIGIAQILVMAAGLLYANTMVVRYGKLVEYETSVSNAVADAQISLVYLQDGNSSEQYNAKTLERAILTISSMQPSPETRKEANDLGITVATYLSGQSSYTALESSFMKFNDAYDNYVARENRAIQNQRKNAISVYGLILFISAVCLYTNVQFTRGSNKATEEEGIQKSCVDELTHLYNRRYVDTFLKSMVESTGSGYLFMCDMDNFKTVNDTLGHDSGDRALIGFANVLKLALRPSDVLCRLGGDEFMIYTPEVEDDEMATAIQDRIRRTLSERNAGGEHEIITLSCGATSVEGKAFAQCYKTADQALYYVKNHGKNGFKIL